MSTIDLGKIKFVWRGAYNNSTAYTPDDVVSSGGSSYICILASTGNAVSNGTYWQQMSAAGTNGTDLTSTLGTQGQIVYRDGSGLAALNAGTSGQVLTTGGTGANPSWGTVSSDYVKLTSGTFSSSSDNLAIDGFTNSAYKTYIIRGMCTSTGNSGNVMRMKLRNGSTDLTAEYLRMADYRATNTSSNTSFTGNGNGSYNQDHWIICHHGSTSDDATMFEITLSDMLSTTHYKNMFSRAIGRDGSQWVLWTTAGMMRPNTNAVTGLKLYTASGSNFTNGDYQVYGIK